MIAGAAALDFVNTTPVVDGAGRELLGSWDDVVRWAGRAGLEAAPARSAAGGARERARWLARAVRLREALRSILQARAAGQALPRGALEVVNAELRGGLRRTELALDEHGVCTARVRWLAADRSPRRLLAAIAESGVEVLCEADPSRVRACEGKGCVLWFLDTSKNGRRRWCSMEGCGNRAKVAAHYRRAKGEQ